MRISIICLLFAFLFCSTAARATDPSSPIDTNRPSFTFSPIVVPKGSLQVENGTLYQWLNHDQDQFDIPETQLRLGLFEKTEFQMLVPNYVLRHSSDQTNSGVQNLSEVGLKHQLPRLKNIQGSLEAALNIPTGRRLLSGTGVQPVFRLPCGMPVGKNYQLCAMPSFLLINSGHDPAYQQTFEVCRSIGSKTTVFAEYAGFWTRGARPISLAHFGAMYKITPHHQIDLQFGFGLNNGFPTAILGGGYSFRMDKLWPSK